MPRTLSLAKSQFDRAVSKLENSILKELVARRLSLSEIDAQYTECSFAAAWQSERIVNGETVPLNLLLPFDFPFAAPSFGLAVPPNILSYPHIEANGTLCILSSSSSVDSTQPDGIVKELLIDADRLLAESFSKANREDFQQEFLSYWSKSGTESSVNFVSLLKPEGLSRVIRVWHSVTTSFFGGMMIRSTRGYRIEYRTKSSTHLDRLCSGSHLRCCPSNTPSQLLDCLPPCVSWEMQKHCVYSIR